MNTVQYMAIKKLLAAAKKAGKIKDQADAIRAIETLVIEVDKLKTQVGELTLQRDSWRGEVRNLLHDRRNVLGEKSDEIIEELYAEMQQRREGK